MNIKLNGEALMVRENIRLSAFLKEQQYPTGTFAVAVNECFVSRSQYDKIELHPDDRVEVVVPMQGG